MDRYPMDLFLSIRIIALVKSSKYLPQLETIYVPLCLLLNRGNSTRKNGISS